MSGNIFVAIRDRWAGAIASRATAVGISAGVLLGTVVATSSIVGAAVSPSVQPTFASDVQAISDTLPAAGAQTVAATQGAPQCPAGQIPILKNAIQPTSRSGAATPEAALRITRPTVGAFNAYPWFERADSAGPVWFVAGSETFLALRLPDGGWFVTPSTFVGCRVPLSH